MNVQQALELANSFALPGFFVDDDSLTEERRRNEEAIKLLHDAWFAAPAGAEPFSYDLVRQLADSNRATCDSFGTTRLENVPGSSLARNLSPDDLIHGLAVLQGRADEDVAKTAGADARDLNIAFTEAPLSGTVLGFDLETTERYPDRGYIVNLGMAFMELAPGEDPYGGHAAYFGIPERYEAEGVPLARIHHIQWSDVAGKTPFREDKRVAEALMAAFTSYPIMAHNAAFEDSWLTLHLDGYAEARKAGRVTIIDSRDIARRIDADGRTVPREQAPYALENWARRRGTLKPSEKERHLGLDDVALMLWTVQAELELRNMLVGSERTE